MERLRRLHQIVEWLRARRAPVTVADLAERFSVSERTVFRDLAALRDGDVPIETSPGPAGGVRLGRSYHLPPLGITLEEAVAMWVTVQIRASDPDDPLRTVLDKVVGGLPDRFRADFEHLVGRIVIGPPAALADIPDATPPASDVYRTCETALRQRERLRLTYVDRTGRPSERPIEVQGLLVLDPVWYLLAYDLLREAPRTFRLDRTVRAEREGALVAPRDLVTLFPCGDTRR